MQHRDRAYIWDMITAAEDILLFVKDRSLADFEADKKTRYAVERQLLVIGEAANHVSEDTILEYNDIPWEKIIGLRNIIAHEYGEILTERIWNVCMNNIPDLLVQLKKIKID